jgi:hypothetical protein
VKNDHNIAGHLPVDRSHGLFCTFDRRKWFGVAARIGVVAVGGDMECRLDICNRGGRYRKKNQRGKKPVSNRHHGMLSEW